MEKEKGSDYYNKNSKQLEKNEDKYEDLYKSACKMLMTSKIQFDEPIVDIGCGAGAFEKYLQDLGYSKCVGIDFSEKSIDRARERFPNFRFLVGNLSSANKHIKKIISKGKVFVCFEVLEHIEDDFNVINLLPKDSLLIFSVPNINGHGHVRSFKDHTKVIDRYKDVLIFLDNTEMIKKGKPHHKLFLFKTVKK